MAARSRTDPLAGLTPSEREVLELVAEGLNNPAIARRLVVSERTAEGHERQILLELGWSNRTTGIAALSRCWPTCSPAHEVSVCRAALGEGYPLSSSSSVT
ncbi:MAG: helix-turn-helix transcriptional regulator [Kineosporiaceae bacterium]